jgi:hypothetical protein
LTVAFMSLHIVYGCKRFSKHKKIISIVFLGMSGTFEMFSSIKYEFLEISNIILTSKIQYLRKLDYSENSIICVYVPLSLVEPVLDPMSFSRDR